ncbi:MAG: hypothetical protein ACE5IW_11880 [bacterium]
MHLGFAKSDEKFVQVVNRLAEMEGSIRVIMTHLDYKERVDEMDYRLKKVEERLEKV